jgi:hypothetical protein
MVLLETAWVNLGHHCQDTCCNYFQYGIYCGADNPCLSCEDYTDELALLGGISSARHLELISEFQNVSYYSQLPCVIPFLRCNIYTIARYSTLQ